METKHTDGPWKHDGDIRVTSDSGDICVVLGYGQTRAANIQNAQLIAAAPCLLDALEKLAVAANEVHDMDPALDQAIDNALLAIGKANGGAD